MKDVLGPKGPRLCSRECDTCLFKPDSPFRKGAGAIRPGRFKELAGCDTYVICHDTSGSDEPAICRGFFDRRSTNVLRAWSRIGGFSEVDPDAYS